MRRLAVLLWFIASAAAAQNIDVVGAGGPRGRFGVGGGASISLVPQVTLHPTVDLSWSKAFDASWGLGVRLSTLGTFNAFGVSGRRRLFAAGEFQLAARLELFGELSMAAGELVAVDPITTWMRPLFGIAPGLALDFGDRLPGGAEPERHPGRRWSLTLDVPVALPGLTGVTLPGTFYETTWAQPYLLPGIASEDRIFGNVSFFSTVQVLLGRSLVAPVVSVGIGF